MSLEYPQGFLKEISAHLTPFVFLHTKYFQGATTNVDLKNDYTAVSLPNACSEIISVMQLCGYDSLVHLQ